MAAVKPENRSNGANAVAAKHGVERAALMRRALVRNYLQANAPALLPHLDAALALKADTDTALAEVIN